MTKLSLSFALCLFFLCSCGGSYDIVHVEQRNDGAYLTFPQGTPVTEGEVFRIFASMGSSDSSVYFSHGRPRKILGRVKVVKVEDDSQAIVQIIEGTVTGGVIAEKAE
ncbi:MAG: hypothetical protein WAO19_07045 [Candidatus Kryptoniota bacterium]